MQESSFQFFGLPGSGKTFILREMLKDSPDLFEPVPHIKRFARIKLSIIFIFVFPALSFKIFQLLFRNKIKLWGYLLHLLTVSFSSHMYAILHRKDTKVFLIDEGIFQRILSVSPDLLSEDQLSDLVKLCRRLSSKVLIVEGGDFGRFVSEPDRMISPRNKFGESYFIKWKKDLIGNFDILKKLIMENGIKYEIRKSRDV